MIDMEFSTVRANIRAPNAAASDAVDPLKLDES
jgi:hypothetical protein